MAKKYKPFVKNTDGTSTEMEIATASSSYSGTIRLNYTTTGKNYKVQVDDNGDAYVNVPWTDTTYTLPTASSSALGGIKTGYTTSGKNYKVQVDSSGNGYVNVPWTDNNTNYYPIRLSSISTSNSLQLSSYSGNSNCALYVPYGTSSQYGVVKPYAVRTSTYTTTTGGTTADRYYGVELDSNGKMFVNVPWSNASSQATLIDSFYSSGNPAFTMTKVDTWYASTAFQNSNKRFVIIVNSYGVFLLDLIKIYNYEGYYCSNICGNGHMTTSNCYYFEVDSGEDDDGDGYANVYFRRSYNNSWYNTSGYHYVYAF